MERLNRQNDYILRLKKPKSGSFCPLKYLRLRLGGLTPDIHNSFLKCAQQTTGTLLGVIKCDIEQTRIDGMLGSLLRLSASWPTEFLLVAMCKEAPKFQITLMIELSTIIFLIKNYRKKNYCSGDSNTKNYLRWRWKWVPAVSHPFCIWHHGTSFLVGVDEWKWERERMNHSSQTSHQNIVIDFLHLVPYHNLQVTCFKQRFLVNFILLPPFLRSW